MKVFLSLIIALVAFQLSPRARADEISNPATVAKLEKFKNEGDDILMCDVDNTIGSQNESTGVWTLYRGAIRFLKTQKKTQRVVLFTANSAKNVEMLRQQYPELDRIVDVYIPAEDFAPLFVKLKAAIQVEYQKIANPTEADWQRLLFEAFLKNPEEYLPPGVKLKKIPQTVEEFRTLVYFNYIAPDKVPTVIRYGILVDDRLARLATHGKYQVLITLHRGLFIGRVGGETANSGPDYAQMNRKIAVERALLKAAPVCDMHTKQ